MKEIHHIPDHTSLVHFPIYNPREKTTKSMELDFLITKNTLITVRYAKIKPLQEFWRDCEIDKTVYFQNSPAFLLHCMLEKLNSFSFRQIDHITRKINDVEKRIFEVRGTKEEEKLVESITLIRRDILDFRRTIKPQSTILRSLKARGVAFFGKRMGPYFTDIIGDHLRVWDLLENHKETIESLQEANDSLLSNRTNLVMKVLTMFAVVVFPLTLLAGIFGMNTHYLPIVGTKYDFWIVVGIMLAGTAFMLAIFRKKKWL